MDASRLASDDLIFGVEDQVAVLYPACVADWISLPALMEFAGEGLIYTSSSKD